MGTRPVVLLLRVGGRNAVLLYEYSDSSVCFLQLHLGGDRNFSYLFGDALSGEGAAVDPGFRSDEFVAAAERHSLKIKHVLITHDHTDHMAAADELIRLSGARLYAGKDEGIEGAEVLSDGDSLPLGDRTIEILSTPGHTVGHMCYLFENRLMTGDLLFCGKVGGTGSGFPGSSARAEWESLKKIMRLPDSIIVFPGHDYYGGEGKMPHSTIGYEKQNNPFLQCRNFNEFCLLKENWADYKAEHGIR
jgi:hydroxyacylglutathione hydrolase